MTKSAVSIAVALLTATALTGCSDQGNVNFDDRAARAVTSCRGHGGVSAVDDDVVVDEQPRRTGIRAS